MKYSVIVPFYHRKPEQVDFAKEVIKKIKEYSQDYELIILDNGSSLNTSWVDSDKKMSVKTNRGITYAWNIGTRISESKYIVHVNDDVLVSKGWLEAMEKCFEYDNCAVSSIHVTSFGKGSGIQENYAWFPGSIFMLSQDTVKAIGYFDSRFYPCGYEDYDYWTRVLMMGRKLYVNYDVSVYHKEGMTVHDKDQSKYKEENRQRYLNKWGFDPIPIFCGGQPVPYVGNLSNK